MSGNDERGAEAFRMTGEIVSAFVSHNATKAEDIGGLIDNVFGRLMKLGVPAVVEPEKPQPRMAIKKTITPDHIISLEDGKPYKTLKRHLSALGMTPEDYRKKWELPDDYPMVAPNYSAKRAELAQSLGLGRNRAKGSGDEATAGL